MSNKVLVLSRSVDFTAGFTIGRYPVTRSVLHVTEVGFTEELGHLRKSWVKWVNPFDEESVGVLKLGPGVEVIILGDWGLELPEYEIARLQIMRVIYESRASVFNGAGHLYDWGYPKAWERAQDENDDTKEKP